MITVGLTGSIAMGKSETAKMFTARGIPVFDSDAAVHELYGPGGAAVPPLRLLVPDAIIDGAVDRRKLANLVQGDATLLKQIETVVHPLVKMRQTVFLADAENHSDIAVLDIPLLFETGREREVDVVVVVSTDATSQRQRALARPGMTPEKFDFILSRQVPDAEKRARADYVIDTGTSREATQQAVIALISALREKASG